MFHVGTETRQASALPLSTERQPLRISFFVRSIRSHGIILFSKRHAQSLDCENATHKINREFFSHAFYKVFSDAADFQEVGGYGKSSINLLGQRPEHIICLVLSNCDEVWQSGFYLVQTKLSGSLSVSYLERLVICVVCTIRCQGLITYALKLRPSFYGVSFLFEAAKKLSARLCVSFDTNRSCFWCVAEPPLFPAHSAHPFFF